MVIGGVMKKKIRSKKNNMISRRSALLGGASSILLAGSIGKPAIAKNIRRLTMTHTWPKNFPGLGEQEKQNIYQ